MDIQKLEHLFLQFSPMAFSVSLSILHSREEAEDVVQELFMKHVPTIITRYAHSSPEELGRLIARSTKNLSIDKYRYKKRFTDLTDDYFETTEDTDTEPDDSTLSAILGQIERSDEEILTLKYLHSMTWAQVASLLGLSEIGARKRGHNAIKRVRKLITKKGV